MALGNLPVVIGELGGRMNCEGMDIEKVKAFNRREQVLSVFQKTNRELLEASTKAQIWAGFMMPFMNVINNISYAFIACIGGVMSVAGMVSVDEVWV